MTDMTPPIGGSDETLRDLLSPTALAAREVALALSRAARQHLDALAAVREEASSPDGDVWSAANGEGQLVALAIDDSVLGGQYTLEDIEDLVSDAMIDASGRGLAVGERITAAYRDVIVSLPGPPSL